MNIVWGGIAALVILAAALVSPGAAAAAQPTGAWSPPKGAIAHWYLNAGGLGPESPHDPTLDLLQRGMLALVEGVFAREGRGPCPAAAILDPGVLGGAAYRITLLDLAVDSGERAKPGGPVALTRFAIVLRVETGERHAELEAVLRDQMQRAAEARNSDPVESRVELPNGTTATSLRVREDPLLQLAWVSTPDAFLIGIGDDALARPTAPAAGGAPGWAGHRKLIGPIHRDAASVMEAYVDLDRLRSAVPDEVGWGTAGELLRAWRISNARSVMVAASAAKPEAVNGPRLLNLSLSWSDRSLPTGNVKAARISTPEWPAVLGPAPEDAAYAIVVPSAWMTWIPMSIETRRALRTPEVSGVRASGEWIRRNLPSLERVIAKGTGVVAIVGPRNAAEGPVIRVPLRSDAHPERVLGDLQQVMSSLGVPYSPESQSWAVECFGHTLTFGLRGSSFIGAWNAGQLPPPGPR